MARDMTLKEIRNKIGALNDTITLVKGSYKTRGYLTRFSQEFVNRLYGEIMDLKQKEKKLI